ncbi:annexin-B12-like [Lingula anatina]|uniref:Annexin n=1 Tax=Lingula anatina TaxID=7574 RepID=A0A1S3HVB1_LINAN|nr:annexin-B12-like [Lingula anatina]|eukprot:XP_013389486.1 annexin-B12-like [Lingula anatina]
MSYPYGGGYGGGYPGAGGYPQQQPMPGMPTPGGPPYPGGAPYPGGGGAPYPSGGPNLPYGVQPPGGMPGQLGFGCFYTVCFILQEQGTVRDHTPFNPEDDSAKLRKAMKGLGTDERAIIDILGFRTNAQRQKLFLQYKTMYGRDLIQDLKSELSGKFEDCVLALMLPPEKYDASELRRAMAGLGTDEDALIEILCTRNNREIQAINAAYKQMYRTSLEQDIAGDTSGHFKRLMVSMANGHRDENQAPNMQKAQQDARKLYDAGEKRWGTDESMFNAILASQSFPQLRAVFDEYQKLSKNTIERVIQSEMSGDLAKGMLTIVKVVKNKASYFAEKMYTSMKGLGTDDKTLIRVVVTRCEVDMVQIKEEFQKKYHQSLGAFIRDDTSGDYKRVLLALCGERY